MVMPRNLDETRAAAVDARVTAQSRQPLSSLAAPAMRQPDLDNGGCACARATAGRHVGTAASDHRVSAWIGNVVCRVVAMPATAMLGVTSSGRRDAWAFAFPVASRPAEREQKA